MGQRVGITDAGEVVIAWIGVATLAIRSVVPDRVIVIPLNTGDVPFPEEWEDTIRMGTEGAKVAETVERLDATSPCIA
jgi:hypothetical protein